MRVVMFYHSLVSCWNHGNAHFLRGVAQNLLERGHEVAVFEPLAGWSRKNLVSDHGARALSSFRERYPELESHAYGVGLDLGHALEGADLVIVHEWNDPDLVARIGARRPGAGFRLLFHDTHHRAVTDPSAMQRYALDHYDGVLAFGEVIRNIYLERGWIDRAFTWHEAADVSVFRPRSNVDGDSALPDGDVAWIGNFGDDERSEELRRYLLEPATALGLVMNVWGVRYPRHALDALAAARIGYHGWLPNHRVPDVFARHRVTVHVPRGPYVHALPGIPTIRPFEALACGIPLVSSPWQDADGLFRVGTDFLMARTPREMRDLLREVLSDRGLSASLRQHGLQTIHARHTCAHRVLELLDIAANLGADTAPSYGWQSARSHAPIPPVVRSLQET